MTQIFCPSLPWFSGRKIAKFDISFLSKGSGFKTKQHIGNLKQICRAPITDLCFSKFGLQNSEIQSRYGRDRWGISAAVGWKTAKFFFNFSTKLAVESFSFRSRTCWKSATYIGCNSVHPTLRRNGSLGAIEKGQENLLNHYSNSA